MSRRYWVAIGYYVDAGPRLFNAENVRAAPASDPLEESMQQEDAALVSKSQGGDLSAFNQIVE